MTRAIRHRGPDGIGTSTYRGAALGLARLSLVDRDAPAGPFSNEDGSVVTICNGEIYNHVELKRDLIARGHAVQTACDTAILPHMYEEFGPEFIKRLDGQFAIALVDLARGNLLLGRDVFGVHPLFFAQCDDHLIFASEIKALLTFPGFRPQLNMTGLDQLLGFPGLVSPVTMFAGVDSLSPGYQLTASSSGYQLDQYRDIIYPLLSDGVQARSEASYRDEIGTLLRSSIGKRLQGSGKIAVYLSGGLDSSLVAAIAQEFVSDDALTTLSLSFGGEEMCERQYQRAVLSGLRTRHLEIPIDHGTLLENLSSTVWHTECPFKELYDVASFVLSQHARSAGISVALTGQGADELFAGYVGYRFDRFRKDATSNSRVEDPETRIRRKLWRNDAIVYDGDYAEIAALKRQLYAPDVAAAIDRFDSFECLNIDASRLMNRDPINQRSYLDLKLRLADHLLGDHGDRMTMAHGIEGRHPFLDEDLVQFARLLPCNLKLNGYTEKYILKQFAASVLPAPIVSREKFAWYAPGTPALLQQRSELLMDILSFDRIKREGVFNPSTIETLKLRYMTPGFSLNHPYELDLLAIVTTFGIWRELFNVPPCS